MDLSSLVAAQLLECNRPGFDQHRIDLATTRSDERRARWRSRLAVIVGYLRPPNRTPASSKKLASVVPAE